MGLKALSFDVKVNVCFQRIQIKSYNFSSLSSHTYAFTDSCLAYFMTHFLCIPMTTILSTTKGMPVTNVIPQTTCLLYRLLCCAQADTRYVLHCAWHLVPQHPTHLLKATSARTEAGAEPPDRRIAQSLC